MIRRLRLFTGLVLFTYVTTHLLNHALGVYSLEAAEAGRHWFLAVWRFPPVVVLLYASLFTHIGLALWALWERRTLRLPRWELIRLGLGLLIPLMLIPHVFGTRVASTLVGTPDTYSRVMFSWWVLNPVLGLQHLALLTVAWTHGWLGVYHWLRVRPSARPVLPALRFAGLLVPLLAMLGFVDMGRDVSVLATDPAWVRRAHPAYAAARGDDLAPLPARSLVPATTVDAVKEVTWGLFVASVLGVLAAREVRALWQRRGGSLRVTYPDGRRVAILPGATILEASRAGGIPHASLCGGRGRCSTCRTRIGVGLEALPPPAADEARVLRRVGAPPNVRLACQTRPTTDVDVFPLLPPSVGPQDDLEAEEYSGGAERVIAILFADMRSFTAFAERRLPYDVVFLLNQYSDAMGRAIERAGGHPNQFVGDGVMALFGLESDPEAGCRDALAGAVSMAIALEHLNQTLAHELHGSLRIGIGIHTGQVIVGEMGYGRARYLTAIGDAVNTASRLEALTKEHDCQLVVSEDVAQRAGVDLSTFPCYETSVRGRVDELQIRIVTSALDLIPALDAAAASRA